MINAFGDRPHSTPIKTQPTVQTIIKRSVKKEPVSTLKLPTINESMNVTGPKKKRVKLSLSINQKESNATVDKKTNGSAPKIIKKSKQAKIIPSAVVVPNSKQKSATKKDQWCNKKQDRRNNIPKIIQNQNCQPMPNQQNCQPISNQNQNNCNRFNNNLNFKQNYNINNLPNPNNNPNQYKCLVNEVVETIQSHVYSYVYNNLYVFDDYNNNGTSNFCYQNQTNTYRNINHNINFINSGNEPRVNLRYNQNPTNNIINNQNNRVLLSYLPHHQTYYNKNNHPFNNNYKFSSYDRDYNPFHDQNHFKRNGFLYNYQLIGDDFFLTVATMELHSSFNNKHRICQSGYCISGQTIRDVTHRVLNWPHLSNNVIVNIGSVDILHGHNLFEMIADFRDMMCAFGQRGIHPIVTTLPPLANMTHIPDVVMTVAKFNEYLRRTYDYVIDLWDCLVDSKNSRILYECYQT